MLPSALRDFLVNHTSSHRRNELVIRRVDKQIKMKQVKEPIEQIEHKTASKSTSAEENNKSSKRSLDTRERQNSAGQMFVQPTILLSLAAVIGFLFSIETCPVDAGLIDMYHKYKPKIITNPQSGSGSGSLQEPMLPNASSWTPRQQVDEQQQLFKQTDETSALASSNGIEYTSPMKRIMELISQHSPVIVVSSGSPSSESRNQAASSTGPQQLHPSQATKDDSSLIIQTGLPSSTSDHQQWTMMDTNQMMQPMHLAAQQQQLIQTTAPYGEQYYVTPSAQHFADTLQQQFAVMPANLAFSPATSYQEIATLPYPPLPGDSQMAQQAYQQQVIYQQQQQQQQQQIQRQQNLKQEDRAQPVFLSSYVPELPVQQQNGRQLSQSTPQAAAVHVSGQPQVQQTAPVSSDERRPNSIQQIQQSQAAQQSTEVGDKQQHVKATEPTKQPGSNEQSNKQGLSGGNSKESADGDSGGDGEPESNSNDSGGSKTSALEEPDYVDSNSDLEEPSKIRRSHVEKKLKGNPRASTNEQKRDSPPASGPADELDEPSNGGNSIGSMTYEDKYDSDKDEPRSVSMSIKHPKTAQSSSSSSNVLANGLVNVGLNDDCLQCICRASSGCDHLLRCITRGSEEKYCGPFQLTEEYWNMAGSPGDAANSFLTFEDCANEVDCAVETVTNYMKKYHKDCDGDENITCMDYARLHRLKPTECENTDKLVNEFDAYWPKFQRCAEGYNRSRNGDDEDI